jgi:hypothetical protein
VYTISNWEDSILFAEVFTPSAAKRIILFAEVCTPSVAEIILLVAEVCTQQLSAAESTLATSSRFLRGVQSQLPRGTTKNVESHFANMQ